VFIEVVLIIIGLISLISLLLSWISLNIQIELREGLIQMLKNVSNPTDDLSHVVRSIEDIQDFLSQLMQVMGNPFQMLAATHGARILDRIFPPKHTPMNENHGDGSLLPDSPSPDPWPAENRQNAEELENVPESN
jgi:hypothetical protein